MALLGLLLGKFLVYCAFFLWVPRLLGIHVTDRAGLAISWAAIRLALGLLGIIPAFLFVAALARIAVSAQTPFYLGLYSVRALIWAGTAAGLTRRHASKRPIPWTGWVALGLLLNLLIDVSAHALGLDDFKYVC